MKRSEINAIISGLKPLIADQSFHLPPFAHWTPEDWRAKGEECREIVDAALGWDVVDFGSGDFGRIGLALFTMRNGVHGDARYPKPYCEKLLIVGEGQLTPDHHHRLKTEDIIVRSGGNLMLSMQNAAPDGELLDSPVTATLDGVVHSFAPGQPVRLVPGQSITFVPYLHHRFWGEPGCGTVLVGEVSSVNDDIGDNVFIPQVPRFAAIEEDCPPLHYLCSDYGKFGVLS